MVKAPFVFSRIKKSERKFSRPDWLPEFPYILLAFLLAVLTAGFIVYICVAVSQKAEFDTWCQKTYGVNYQYKNTSSVPGKCAVYNAQTNQYEDVRDFQKE